MLNIQEFIEKCKAFGFDAEMLEKCDAYYRGCRTAKRNDVIESGDIKTIQTSVNRWFSLQGVERKPRRTKEEMQYQVNSILKPFDDIKILIKKANSKECTKYKELLDSLIIICNERINEVKKEEIKELEEEIQMLQSLLDEMKK